MSINNDNNKLNNKRAVVALLYFFMLIVLGILLEIGAVYILNAVYLAFPSLNSLSDNYNASYSALTSMEPKMVVYVIAVAPLIEEMIFRAGLIGLGRKYIKFWIINIIQSVLFGVYHGNIIQGVYAFLLGMILGVLFQYGGFVANLTVHVVLNASGLYIAPILYSTDSAVADMFIGIAVCALVAGVIYMMIKRGIKFTIMK